ncbi:MAG: polyprenyl synthetase family protein [Polyangiaceae bacterium]|nr:polyprenyl synthetase family protein [Polyangiaceae bacterium]
MNQRKIPAADDDLLDVPVSVSSFVPDYPDGVDPVEAFSDLLDRVRRDVDARLAGYLDARVAETARHGTAVEAMTRSVRELTLRGGKRLRAALVVVGYLASNARLSPEPALDAGVAFELLQTYLLVHDDWMDGDDVRRGGPSVPAMLREHHGSRALGDAAAVLAGDFAAALSLDVLSRLDSPADRLVRAMSLFAEIQQNVICGQQIDIVGYGPDLETSYSLKTGSYTVRGPLLLGATLAGAAPEVIHALESYSAPLGVAFQMQDDVLGTFGDPKRTGKPVGDDLRRGANTVVAAHARSMLHGDARAQFDAVFGNAEATDDQVRQLTHTLVQHGVRGAIVDRIFALIHQAIAQLVDVPFPTQVRLWLLGFCSVIASRIH